jgi:hypothetical protein
LLAVRGLGLGSCRPEAGKANQQRTRLHEVDFILFFISFKKTEKMSFLGRVLSFEWMAVEASASLFFVFPSRSCFVYAITSDEHVKL